MMFEALTLLPPALLNQSFASYVSENFFAPLNMSRSTYSIAEAEAQTYPGEGNTTKTFAHGHLHHLKDFYRNQTGYLKPNIPYFARPGEEEVWAGAGGVLTSPRDLVRISLASAVIPEITDTPLVKVAGDAHE
jgi:CubicO group peptidase (beta-lactamase class C family)